MDGDVIWRVYSGKDRIQETDTQRCVTDTHCMSESTVFLYHDLHVQKCYSPVFLYFHCESHGSMVAV